MNWSKYVQHLIVLLVTIQALPFSAMAEVFFRENKGQVKDQNWQPRPDVLYSYDEGGLHVHLKKDGLHYQLYNVLSWKQEEELGLKHKTIDSLGIYRIDVQWLNTNKSVQIERGSELAGYENFYNVPDGKEPALLVKRYKSLVYKNIYEKIDLHFFEGTHSGLEYDYIVQPDGNYQDIQWQVNGASLSVNANKELILKTPYGDVVEGALLVMQGNRKIDAEWQLNGNVVSVRITGNYDKKQPLRIDPPVRLWGTYYAGTGLDGLLSCVEDAAGNVYTVGDASANNMATSGAHQTTLGQGSTDALLAKFNTNGQRIWATYYGGPSADLGKSCGVDAANNVYLIGSTQSVSAISTNGIYQTTLGGNTDVFIAKFNTNGVRQWGTYYGGTNGDITKNGVVDDAGNIYVCGNASYTSTAIASTGAHQVGYGGGLGQDCFLGKFNTNGQRVWGTYYGGNADDRPGGCAVDALGNVYLAGWTASGTAIATTGAHQTAINNQGDAFLVKFNSNGVRQWGTYYGGAQEDRGASCGADAAGNVYILGITNSTSLIATVGTHQSNFAGTYDAFLVKFNSTGARQWGTYYGGTGNEDPKYLHSNAAGDVLITGATTSATLIATTTAHQTANAGGSEGFLTLFNTNGQRTWGTYYGGSDFDQGQACYIGGSGFYYICGNPSSNAGIATSGTYQATSNGGGSFLAKFEACPPNGSIGITTNSPICAGQDLTLSVPAFTGATYTWGGPNGFNLFNSNISNPTITNAGVNASGMYGITVTISGCPGLLATVSVVVNAAPTITASNNGPVCAGQAVNLSVSALPNATYTWSGPAGFSATTQNPTIASALAPNAGVYSVSVTSNGCVATASTTVTVNPIPSVASGSNSPVCVGQTLQFNAGSQPGLTYAWTGPNGFSSSLQNPSIPNVTLADTGSYTLLLTAANGCTNNPNVKVNVINTPVAPTISGAAICAGQTTNLNVTAPSGATFAWFAVGTGGTAVFTGNPFVTPTLNSNTTYYVEAQAGSCVSSRTAVTVTVNPSPAAPIASTLTPGVCRDSVAVFQVSSTGTTFNWYATGTSTTVLGTGSTFTSPPLPASGSYFVERVENGCPSSRTQVFVQVITAPDPTPANTQICAGTSATINSNISNAFTVNWYNAPSTITPIFTGTTFTTPALSSNTTYYAQTFVNGCPSARVPVTVTVVTPPAAPTVSGTSICSGQTATLNATAPSGVTFAWFTATTGGTAIFTGNSFTTPVLNSNTTYFVESQVGTCNSPTRTSVDVVVNSSPIVNVSSNSPICEGSDLNLTVNATTNASYTWSGPNGFTSSQQNPSIIGVGVNASGNYSVTVSANGCSTNGSLTVAVNPLPIVNATYNSPLCEGSDLNLTVSTTANATYNWNGPNGYSSTQQNPALTSVQLSQAGSYSVTVTSAQGCSASSSVNVVVNAALNLSITAFANPSAICIGQSATLTASGATNYTWSNGLGTGAAQNVSPSSTTTYSVTATDAATGCSAVANTSVTVNPLPNITINASQTTLCEAGSATLTASGADSYFWSTNETSVVINVSPTTTTIYTVTGTDANGCSSTASQNIDVLNFATPQFAISNNITLCYGNNAPTLPSTSTNGITGVWQPSTISNTQSNTYAFTPDGGQCASTYDVNVVVQQINMTAGPDTLVELASQVELFASVSGSTNGTYNWSPAENINCFDCSNPLLLALRDQVYTVTYTDPQTGCSANASVNIDVNYDPNTIFFIPNAFSPNGDGNNDVFEINGLKIKEIDLNIFNRWGELVFSEKSASPKWDGTYKGELQNPDVFIYHTFIIFFNNQVVQTKGSVTIIR